MPPGEKENDAAPSVIVQVWRGIGWTVVVLALAGLVDWVDPFSIHWKRLAVVVAIVAAGAVVGRQLRRWPERPGWLVPVAAGVLAAVLVPAFWHFPNPDSVDVSCTAAIDAWRPVVPTPSAATQTTVNRDFTMPPSIVFAPPPQKLAWERSLARLDSDPAVQQVQRWESWGAGQGPCAPRSRRQLAVSGLILVAGAVGLTVAVRRRRQRRPLPTTTAAGSSSGRRHAERSDDFPLPKI